MPRFHDRTILFRAGDFIFATYGLMAFFAFGSTSYVILAYLARVGMDPVAAGAFLLLGAFPAVLVGARLFSILLEWRQLFVHPIRTLLKPGYMLHGGIAGGLAAIIAYNWGDMGSFFRLADSFGFAMPLGESVMRWGCFVYGCCWGAPTSSRFGVCYTSPHSKVLRFMPHLHGVSIHPHQVYASVLYGAQFLLFFAMLPLNLPDGMFTALFLFTHPILRVFLERFRHDDRGKLWGPFTHTHAYAAVQMMAGVLVGWLALSRGAPSTALQTWPVLVTEPIVLIIAGGVGVAAALAFGLHYKTVGSWIPAKAIHPHVVNPHVHPPGQSHGHSHSHSHTNGHGHSHTNGPGHTHGPTSGGEMAPGKAK
jgi:prolipoprotein diacylglyceryl transferase